MNDTKKIIGVLIALLVILVIEMIVSIYHIGNYGAQKASGNARWQQVEQRIVNIEDKVREIENKQVIN